MSELNIEDKFNECFGHLSKEYVFSKFCQNLLEQMNYAYRMKDVGDIICDDNIQKLWKNFPDFKSKLMNLMLSTARETWGKHPTLPKQDALRHLTLFFSDIDQAEHDDCYLYNDRVYNANLTEPNLNWIEKFKEYENNSERAKVWRLAALNNSRDKSVFSFFYSRIKNGKGSIDEKREVLELAIKANSLPEDIVEKIAESAPISLRRMVVDGLSQSWSSLKREEIYGTHRQLDNLQERKDRIQKLALLFATIDDYTVIEKLSEMLEPSNLSWIVGNAAKHRYISESISRRMSAV